MRHWRVALVMCVAAGSAALGGQAPVPTRTVLLPLVPRPATITRAEGLLQLEALSARRLREFCSNDRLGGQPWVAEMGKPMTTAGRNVISKTPPLRISVLSVMKEYGDEGYRLAVSPAGIVIESRMPAGAFYGAQTLCQMIPAERVGAAGVASSAPIVLPAMSIVDAPRFRWRGMHLDVSRHFFTKDEIKQYIDLLARFKLNVFHWHLTDDGGWRLEIKKYPKLTAIGAWRRATTELWNTQALDFPGPDTGAPLYGGFYSQDDVREIVAYAASRNVTVVPEIELPGHAIPALFAQPELMCDHAPPVPGRAYRSTVMCPGKDSTFAFIEAVLDEVVQLFPSNYIHIGGDDVDRAYWTACTHCQQRMKAEGLSDPAQLRGYTIKRVAAMLTARGRTLVGRDEILDGGIAPSAVVMSWRGMTAGVAAARAGHAVVMSPASHCDFDRPSSATSTEQVYGFDPVPPGLSADEAHLVLGGQGNVWTETIPDFPTVEKMALPRMLALAEVLWSPKTARSFGEFERRLHEWYPRFDVLGVSYGRSSDR